MKKIITICFVAMLVFVSLAKAGTWPASGSWTYLEMPTTFGAVNAYALKIDGQNIVGYYNQGDDDSNQCFFYDGTNWSAIDNIAGATSMYVLGVDGTNYVGSYTDASYVSHGFMKIGANLTILDVDVAVGTDTYASNISGNKIVGSYTDVEGANQGFIYDLVSETYDYTSLLKAGAVSLNPNSIDGSNIIGEYFDGDNSHNFLYDGANWNTNPDALLQGSVTRLFDIDGSNIIGDYTNSLGLHNFLHDGTTFYDLPNVNVAGTTKTSFSGISGDNAVGWYRDSSGNDRMFVYNMITVIVSEPSTLVLLAVATLVYAFFSSRKKH